MPFYNGYFIHLFIDMIYSCSGPVISVQHLLPYESWLKPWHPLHEFKMAQDFVWLPGLMHFFNIVQRLGAVPLTVWLGGRWPEIKFQSQKYHTSWSVWDSQEEQCGFYPWCGSLDQLVTITRIQEACSMVSCESCFAQCVCQKTLLTQRLQYKNTVEIPSSSPLYSPAVQFTMSPQRQNINIVSSVYSFIKHYRFPQSGCGAFVQGSLTAASVLGI